MRSGRKRGNVARSIETGAILGALTLVLAVTGVLLSPTVSSRLGYSAVQAGAGNALYAAHMAAAVLLGVFLVIHLWPFAHAFTRKATASWSQHAFAFTLLALTLVQGVTGLVLWAHEYRVLPKALAVKVHLVVTLLLLAPLVPHALRGARTWAARRAARERALASATRAGRGAAAREQHARVTRRAFARAAAYAVTGVALAVAFGRAVTEQVSAWRLNAVGETPVIPREEYALTITGLVREPVTLSFDELVALGPVTKRFTMHCVEGWSYTDEFTGVPLRAVLERAGGVRDGAEQLVFKSPEKSTSPFAHGELYTTNFPVDDGFHEDVLLVYLVGRQPLPRVHGGPVRLLTPRKWGYKSCKWLTEIEVTANTFYMGYWEKRGYHNDGDYPGPIFA